MLLGATALAGALAMMSSPAAAQQAQRQFEFNINAQTLDGALREYARAANQQLIFADRDVRGRKAPPLAGSYSAEEALQVLLAGTDLSVRRTASGVVQIAANPDPQSGSAAGDGAEVEALIVTAQKREEDIQDVPIAISAFTQEQLERSQVAGGPDLITQVPNMSFTKTNFSSYSIQLRGIGTQAISATVDPAVAVAFNNTPFIRNRFFEQEFYDLQRVEVLRGPQGTLYGRNATAGVVNLISQKARLDTYEAKLSGDLANYNSTRLEGMVNIPLANDVAALRIAGAWTKREGYSTNEVTGNPIDGRDLWSTRVSLRLAPNDRFDANLIWEHFEENDDRLRSGKQLCKTDVVTNFAGFDTPNFYQPLLDNSGFSRVAMGVQASFSQGCAPASLYSPDSYQKTNSLALPYFAPLSVVTLPISQIPDPLNPAFLVPVDPYASRTQSPDLRVIEAAVDPGYMAKTDIAELQFSYDLTDTLTLNSETSWASDFIFSTQDYNRFAGSAGAWDPDDPTNHSYVERGILRPDGMFCDPQIGCSDRLVAMDLSTARSRQFSQEFRLASDFDGPFNFSLGGNFLRYDTEDKYYVFINSLTMISAYATNGNVLSFSTGQWVPGVTDNRDCLPNGMIEPDYTKGQPIMACAYIDPNPITSLNDLGHNYFLSRNPYKLISYAIFGEAYYNVTDNLKVTAGLRWTVDKKEAPLIPSWLLASGTAGYPVFETVRQEWREPTGRLAIDWKPDLAFTDETMVYASLSHGYKAGGMNPPPYGKAFFNAQGSDLGELLAGGSATHPKTFDPEFIDALEIGAKNTLLGGSLTLNVASFYYDYKGYQLSQIVDRSAVTDNFDATVWGLELESDWRPTENLRFGLKLGYENTKVADGERAVDLMDRVAGHEGWTLLKPFPSVPSNCVMPEWLFLTDFGFMNVGSIAGGGTGGCELAYFLKRDPATDTVNGLVLRSNVDYPAWSTDPADYPCWPAGVPITQREYPGVDLECLAALSNNGEGFYKELAGNELPNAPHYTATLMADYTLPLPSDWLMTLHTDLYYQSEAWTRIFNTEGYDKLKAYTNVNVAAIFTNEDAGWKVMAYVKNVFDRDSITGAFLNSDDSGLTTNVFLTEPRLYGLRITKDFSGGPWWTGGNLNHSGSFPLTVELGGQLQRFDAPRQSMTAPWLANLAEEVVPEDVQDRDLDTGDGRSVKLTYRPDGSPWFASASLRSGEANNEMSRDNAALSEIVEVCAFPAGHPFNTLFCNPSTLGTIRTVFWHVQQISWSDAEARSREDYQVADLTVGHDFTLAGLSSTLSVGVRHGELQSTTHWAANAQGDWDMPVGWLSLDTTYHRRHITLEADREFQGSGPVASWDGAARLWSGDEAGIVSVDWSVSGGALYGRQKTTIAGTDTDVVHQGLLNTITQAIPLQYQSLVAPLPVVDTIPATIDITRSDRATVPILDLSLGLSYDVGRIKVSTGYRWERYFDVLDVGYDEEQSADRTIDGPYFKLAVGFGG